MDKRSGVGFFHPRLLPCTGLSQLGCTRELGSTKASRQGLGMEEEVEEGCPGGGLSKTAAKTPPWGALKCQV